MRFITVAALLASPLAAFAQNAFKVNGDLDVTAGQTTTLEWTPTTDGTVSLVLRYGRASNLAAGMIIATGLPNSGSYTWDVPADTVQGDNYTVEIIDDTNVDMVNYTPLFAIDSDVTGEASTAAALSTFSVAAVTSNLPSSARETTATTTSDSETSEVTVMPTTGSSTRMDSPASTTVSDSSSQSNSDSMATSTTEDSSQSATTDAATTAPSDGAAPKASAFAGLVGALALGVAVF